MAIVLNIKFEIIFFRFEHPEIISVATVHSLFAVHLQKLKQTDRWTAQNVIKVQKQRLIFQPLQPSELQIDSVPYTF